MGLRNLFKKKEKEEEEEELPGWLIPDGEKPVEKEPEKPKQVVFKEPKEKRGWNLNIQGGQLPGWNRLKIMLGILYFFVTLAMGTQVFFETAAGTAFFGVQAYILLDYVLMRLFTKDGDYEND